MKTTFIVLVAMGGAAGTSGCGGARSASAGATEKELAQRYLRCDAALQASAWATYERDCLAVGFTGHREGGDVHRTETIAFWRGVHTAFSDLRLDPQLVLVDGRSVFAILLITGTQDGILHCHGDWPASNKRIGLLAMERVAFDDAGRITDEWLYYDSRTVRGQIGALPAGEDPTRAPIADRWVGAPIIAVSTDGTRDRAHKRVVQELTDAINAHHPAQAAALLTDDAVDSDPGQDVDHRGREALEKGFAGLLSVVPDYHRDVPELFAAGDYVVAPGVKTGTWGRSPLKLRYIELAKLEGQRIAALWRFYDVTALEDQVAAGLQH